MNHAQRLDGLEPASAASCMLDFDVSLDLGAWNLEFHKPHSRHGLRSSAHDGKEGGCI